MFFDCFYNFIIFEPGKRNLCVAVGDHVKFSISEGHRSRIFDFRRYIRRRGSSRLGCLASKEAANLDVKF